ncbi:hypothetical protein [Thermopirellula anaerolimosa]
MNQAIAGTLQEPSRAAGDHWGEFFSRWPSGIPKRGILVTLFGEQVPFSAFLYRDGILFVERTTPDQLGGRALLIPFEQIAAVKFLDVVKTKSLELSGFRQSESKAEG